MVPLDYLSVARFSGEEATVFLQSQLSADIDALKPGAAGFACFCTPKGKVIGLLLICRQEADYLVVGAAAVLPHILARLKIFVMRTRVKFDLEPALSVVGLDPSGSSFSGDIFQAGELGLHYGFSPDVMQETSSIESFRASEIRKGVVWLGEETTEKFIPQMLGYEQIGAVSFSKGCYPGQEIVARTRYLGKVKRKPDIVQTVDPLVVKPATRLELRRDETWSSGVVVDSSRSKNGTILFIVAPVEPERTTVELRDGDHLYRCATT